MTDSTIAIKKRAKSYKDVDEGTSCSQTSFKTGGKAFLFIGEQGGRRKAMFKLKQSRPDAVKLAKSDPDKFEIGSGAWVTARFSDSDPMPVKLWKKWLDESYHLSAS